MGGTELVSALESVLRSRTRAPVRPTSIFVLTDGEVSAAAADVPPLELIHY